MNILKHKKIKNKKYRLLTGFTIVELVLAIFILSFAVFGVYNAFSTMVVLVHDVSDRFIAAYLTQEGLEIIRNMRDNNWLNMTGNFYATWIDGLTDCQDGCEADYKTGTSWGQGLTPWPSGGSYLYVDEAHGFYDYNTNNAKTKFKRKITIKPITGADYILKLKVSVLVTWEEKANILNPDGALGSIEAEETLYDWY